MAGWQEKEKIKTTKKKYNAMKRRAMKIQSNNPVGAFAGAKNVTTPVLANADGTSNTAGDVAGESSGTPWWGVVGSIGNTVSGLLGAIFPFFDKRNNSTTIVKNDSNDMFKYLIFGVLAVVVIMLVFRLTAKK